ncbi:hypothetical protein BDR26DRAFT_894004 [Obelidium mucronatum]|nr:hypothetical protein BDR26DRAFT_894004 [Obelidium mucronatum]
MAQKDQWQKYSILSGDTRLVRFQPPSAEQIEIPKQVDNDKPSASIYREIIASNVAMVQHSNPQFVKRIERKRKRIISSDTKTDTKDGDFFICEVCKTRVKVALADSHKSTTCHLFSQLETEGTGSQPAIYAFSERDVGYRMLQKQGWVHGEVLGHGQDDDLSRRLKFPVAPRIKLDQSGLGSTKNEPLRLRVGDSFRKTTLDQLEGIGLRQQQRRKSTSDVKKSHKELLRDAKKEREKGLALLSYLNN